MSALLDVNVLVALAWPNHIHHGAASEWFRRHHENGWSTCPLTESGFVRVSSNRAAMATAVSTLEALDMLRRWRELPGHEFWVDDVSIATSDEIDESRIHGYRQITDAHLLVLAVRHGGRLVTFDASLRQLADSGDDLLILATDP